ncbi:MAG TPA: MFS transporter [Rectinemataceae bacterium]|nr:MFS transporter [Rectinemataceae bacterium]
MRNSKSLRDFLSRYPPSDRKTFSVDAPAGICFGVFNGLSITFIGIIGRKIGLDSHMLAILSISAFVGLFLNVWTGHLSDRGHKEAWVFWPSVVSRVAVSAALVRISPWLYLAVMSGYNVLSNLGGPAYTGIMRSNYSDRYRGELMGYVRIGMQISTALSAALAGALMQALPGADRALFPVAAAFGVASSVIFRRIRVPPAPAEDSAEARTGKTGDHAAPEGFLPAFKDMTKDRLFMAYMAIYFVIGFPDKIVVALEPIRFVDELRMDYAAAGLIQGTIPLAGALLGYFVYAKLADRISPFVALMATALLSSARYLNTALALAPLQLIPGAFLNGIANAGWDLIPMFSLMLFARRERLSLYFGFHSTLIGLRGMIGPVVGTWLYSGLHVKIPTIYLISFFIELGGTALLLPFYARLRSGGIYGRS